MKKFAIIVGSTSGVDYTDVAANIFNLRMTVTLNKTEYVDYVDIKAEDFYQLMLDNPDADIMTSQISVGVFEDKINELKSKGYTDVLIVTISSKLSGTYNSALIAKSLVTDINVAVFDSRLVSYGELHYALVANKLAQEGQNLTEIVEKLEKIRDNMNIYILVDTLKYLVKNGRLSGFSGFIGSLLKIKPLLTFLKDGRLVSKDKIRTFSKAQAKLIELILKEIKGKEVIVFIPYTTNLTKAEELKQIILAANPEVEVLLTPLTPVVGAHAGPGTLAVGYVILN